MPAAAGTGSSAANSPYIGRATSRATPLDNNAHAIRLSTMDWPDTISMTMMKAVIGPWVVAARKPTMPSAINGIAVSGPTPISNEMSRPMPAPMVNDGAKTPAGTPVQADSQVAQYFNSVKTPGNSDWLSSIARVGA